MVEIIRSQLNIHFIKSTIVYKARGFEGPGAFVFKNGDVALFVGYSGDIGRYLQSSEFDDYSVVGRIPNEGIKYTHIEQYLTQNNYLAACLADWLKDSLRPIYNKEGLVRSRLDIIKIYEEYDAASSEEKYHIARNLSFSTREEKFEDLHGKQLNIDEAWGMEDLKEIK